MTPGPEEQEPYTWAKLKEFCNGLSDEQLSQTVRVIQEEGSLQILEAAELGEDMYLFDDEEFSVSKDDFDPEYDLDGRYTSFEEAIENEPHSIAPKTNVYLYEKF